jgi:hypothetical protein
MREKKHFFSTRKNILIRYIKLFSRHENIFSKLDNLFSRLGYIFSKLENNYIHRFNDFFLRGKE